MHERERLNVLITVDVEVWPAGWRLDPAGFADDFRRYIYGPTPNGEYGLPVQLEMLAQHGMRGVFLVESLFACEFGSEPLAEIVQLIQQAGQEVQMHLHPEWVGHMSTPLLEGRAARKLLEYSEADQTTLIRHAFENLQQAGAGRVTAFRAGGYAGNRDTLSALAANGLAYDTSYNPCILGEQSGISRNGPLLQPTEINGVVEFPVSCFQDWPGHLRHVQLGACSFAELSRMMMQAWKQGWRYFVIVSHGFELLTPDKRKRDPVVSRRFARLLEFMSRHRDKFASVGFNDLEPTGLSANAPAALLKSHPARTAWRYAEQVARRWYA